MGVGVSLSRLASAVANEGAIGVIAAAGIGMKESDFYSNYLQANTRALRNEIRKAKSLTKGILGLNIMVAFSNFGELAAVAMEEQIDIIFSGAGLPLNLPKFRAAGSKTRLVPIVSSGRAASLICRHWLEKYDYLPDAFVVEGPKAGGHLGFKKEQIFDPEYALEKLVQDVIGKTGAFAIRYGKKIPVIAAGGIYTGADIRKFIDMGADGVQMGTRFVATNECDADIEFKNMYVNSKREDIVIIDSPVGMPGRAIRNQYIDDVSTGKKKPVKCPYHCIITCDYENAPYCIANALINAQKGRFDNGFAFAGANAYRVSKIVSLKELIKALIFEYNETFLLPQSFSLKNADDPR
jgi:NAD(P)H-dependent flavin oxidoreductase YrpB (nitropropane dioxygenase family)